MATGEPGPWYQAMSSADTAESVWKRKLLQTLGPWGPCGVPG
eukprot:CAMPEP_0202891838 /NCGR_PEP_ID=MMETSP1392-20130828/1789_1 /ASSEMBLY_ACC=CAM_ASM_000868 /TAXON_ID=225041 /ORGANISM="Chlamydomonas chlamydogama, Strain SAG 11-48b" /LENGTH=41 /DNA_ID= /DNA_START= /DNA_END= /DNA_ORIENTATION=